MASFIHQFIEQSAGSKPYATALYLKSDSLTYNELNTQIHSFASGLSKLALNHLDRVGIYLHKTFETVISIFGTSCAGGVFVPINPVLKAQQVTHIVNDCEVKYLVTNKGRLKSILSTLDNMPSLAYIVLIDGTDKDKGYADKLGKIKLLPWKHIFNSNTTELTQPNSPQTIDDIAAILYTSGSTGKPKGVVLSHNNLALGAKSVAGYLENTHKDVILAVLPLSFDYGLSQLTTCFYVGASCVLLDYLLPNDVLKTIDKFQVTGLACVPPLWSQLCALKWNKNTGSSIRYYTNSGGALSTTNILQLKKLMPSASPYLMYGLTEAFRSTYLPPEEIENRPTSMGKAIPNVKVMVVRPDGTECNANEAGELIHTGPLVSLGYWNSPEKTAARFKPITHSTNGVITNELAVWSGDTVVKDEEGFLYFVSRSDDMIKTSGYRVSPTEIEDVIYQYQDITEAIALGVKHDTLGQAIIVIACCATEQNMDKLRKNLLHHCQTLLANYLQPKDIIILKQLPHNANGKIDKTKLSNEYANYYQVKV